MIEFKHVNKKYPNGFEALKDIDLTIGQGEFVAIIGLSGAGKSTLIRTINRMHDITNGTLTVDGTDVMQLHGKSLRAFRRRIGMIFQSFNLVTRTTVIKNVLTAFVPELPWWRAALGIFTKAEKTAALEALDKVGILDKAFVRADQLSGGQQQRVALARTLAQNPQIILADEVLTPDSSRFWPGDEYAEGKDQPSFDKQFVRDWLNANWDRQGNPPRLPQDIIDRTSEKYIQAYEKITGRTFVPFA